MYQIEIWLKITIVIILEDFWTNDPRGSFSQIPSPVTSTQVASLSTENFLFHHINKVIVIYSTFRTIELGFHYLSFDLLYFAPHENYK